MSAAAIFGNLISTKAQSEAASPIDELANDPDSTLGLAGSELGQRSTHAKVTRFLRPGKPWTSGTPHEDLVGTITPADLHFERHHSGIPTIDPSEYVLMIHGMVERPTVFTLEDLKRFPSVSRTHFLECSGHYPYFADEKTRPSRVAPLLSNSEWTGVALRTLLKEVGVHQDATWLIAEGQDAGKMVRSVPIEKAWDDSMIAYGQNGESIRPEQGYPARLFNPGWEGNTSIKWLRQIEVTNRPSMTRSETARYTEKNADGKVRQFSFVMDARSLITYPGYPETIQAGMVEIQGIAWSGRGKIAKVEISSDDGKTWSEAQLQRPILSKALTRFQYSWKWNGEPTTIWSRAIDETGYVQPNMKELKTTMDNPKGYHGSFTVGWNIKGNGDVFYRVQ